LDPRQSIGDFVVVEKSLSADGFTRYLGDHPAAPDRFLADTWPDPDLTATLAKAADSICKHHGVALHSGAVVSVDSIIAQFTRMDRWTAEKSLVGVEMETAATFEAARLSGIKAAALLQVSDVVPTRKTLFSGRTEKDSQRRQWARRTVLPGIVLSTLAQMSAS
jgi:purine-nucleoside phosphorylase